MKARQEKVKVIYPTASGERPEDHDPTAIILTGGTDRKPVVYRLSRLSVDELGNLFESGDPDMEADIVVKAGK